MMPNDVITKAQLARELGVSRAYITMIANGKRKPSQKFVNKINRLNVNTSYLNLNGVQVVAGSNPAAPTTISDLLLYVNLSPA
jgi:transcriptional regulator with XRE-family HTH domain